MIIAMVVIIVIMNVITRRFIRIIIVLLCNNTNNSPPGVLVYMWCSYVLCNCLLVCFVGCVYVCVAVVWLLHVHLA